MNRASSFVFTAAAIAATLLSGSAFAADYTLVTGTDYAPFSDSGAPGGGIATEVVKQAFGAAGKSVEITVEPWKRGYQDTLKGNSDATFPYVQSAGRLAQMKYSDPIFNVSQVVFSASDHPINYQGPASLTGKTVCNPLGYALPAAIDALIKAGTVKVQSPPNLPSCAKMVAAGHADFIVGDAFTVSAAIAGTGLTGKVTTHGTPVSKAALYLIVGKDNPKADAELAAFNEGLKKLKADGKFDAIVKQALGS